MQPVAGETALRIGVDLGGTKIEIIALDAGGAVLERTRIPTPGGDYAATLAAIANLVAGVEGRLGRAGSVGVGSPGALRPDGTIKNANSTMLNGRPLQRDLETALDRPIRLENDANCLALSEALDGAGRGARVVFGLIMGTGVGGGIVVDGTIARGPNAIAGEWGHNPLPWPRAGELPGPRCYCGKDGCIETFLSGPGLTADARARGSSAGDARAAIAAATERDGPERDAVVAYGDRFARALATVLNLLDPDVVVLGGGLSRASGLVRLELLERYVFGGTPVTPVRVAEHGDSSGVRGAAWLGAQR